MRDNTNGEVPYGGVSLASTSVRPGDAADDDDFLHVRTRRGHERRAPAVTVPYALAVWLVSASWQPAHHRYGERAARLAAVADSCRLVCSWVTQMAANPSVTPLVSVTAGGAPCGACGESGGGPVAACGDAGGPAGLWPFD
jgi:hypothetical protein